MRIHKKESAHFSREIAEKTLLVGLGSTIFREATNTRTNNTRTRAEVSRFRVRRLAGGLLLQFVEVPVVVGGLIIVRVFL